MSRPVEQIRWTIGKAAVEFSLSPKTVSKRLKAAGIVPGADGHYSTLDFVRGLYGDYERHRDELIQEQTRKVRMENEVTEGTLVNMEFIAKSLENLMIELRQRILSSALPEVERHEILRNLASIDPRPLCEQAAKELEAKTKTEETEGEL